MEVVVARIGRPHGVRGEVSVEVRTDSPGERFAGGAVFSTDPASAGPLTLAAARDHNGVLLLSFEGVNDRNAAEGLRGVLLVADVDATSTDEPDAWSVPALVGLRAERTDGRVAGEVIGVEHGPAQDLLVVKQPSGSLARVPFVAALVPVVDVDGGRVVLDPPGGLLEGDGAPEDAR
ncbi:16S rRNA processing protein RimM [Quadrisphaera granulorum]|uniref:Ribosome maturation factor RimM n=1 Tax=Quadrisphaera granulorum TaxID=317664 RepID=A0A316AGJ4_9ACTN|nr:ribosome maturation factor RimM [Quadrisphaera granulorum]PWJ56398.1 16S rRNA processing protein RimM [Quadrisphaera granulorum]SZE95032.1 16S rRNA processing protein RimM [Quadrisphaera granulorum]